MAVHYLITNKAAFSLHGTGSTVLYLILLCLPFWVFHYVKTPGIYILGIEIFLLPNVGVSIGPKKSHIGRALAEILQAARP